MTRKFNRSRRRRRALPNIQIQTNTDEFNLTTDATQGPDGYVIGYPGNVVYAFRDLIKAPTGGVNSSLNEEGYTPYTMTVGNLSVNGTLEAQSQDVMNHLENVSLFIMFLPEGYSGDKNLPILHPEWILSHKYLGSPTSLSSESTNTLETQTFQPFRLSTRIRRRLKTGDKIIMMLRGALDNYEETYAGPTGTLPEAPVRFNYIIRWRSKVN